jgi:hypothetical protein
LIGENSISVGTRNFNKTGDISQTLIATGSNAAQKPPSPELAGTSTFNPVMMLRLVVEAGEPLLIKPQPEMILGRRDPATGAQPDIDLTPYAGYRMGVSRRHAAIRRSAEQFLELWDLGSSNGTFLNGTKLISYRPNRLRDGDEIKLGKMAMRIFFEIPTPEKRGKTSPFTTASPNSASTLPKTGGLRRNSTGSLLSRLGLPSHVDQHPTPTDPANGNAKPATPANAATPDSPAPNISDPVIKPRND